MRRTDHRGRTVARGRATSLVAVLIALLLLPSAAFAHAHLRRSDPKAGATTAAPTVIRLWFTEEPELSLTSVRLVDAAGTVVRIGAPVHDVDGALSIRLPIENALHAGRYTVTWRTAALDGHPSNGSFGFTVDVPAAVAVPPSAVARPASRAPALDTATTIDSLVVDVSVMTPAYVIARAVSFVALLALIGAVAFRYAVLPRIDDRSAESDTEMLRALATGAAVSAAAYLLAALLRLWLQNWMMEGDAMADATHMRLMAMETHWGGVWRIQFIAGAAALAGALLARSRWRAGWIIVAIASAALALGAALGGHAGAAESLRVVAVLDDALHVIGAAGWLGSLLWLVVAALPTLRPEESRASRAAALVRAYSPTALLFAGLVGATGVVSAWLRLGSVAALWTSIYGQVLLVKLALLVGVAGTGFYNWRYVQPALGTDVATLRLRRTARIELSVGLLVLLVTAVLVATPLPG